MKNLLKKLLGHRHHYEVTKIINNDIRHLKCSCNQRFWVDISIDLKPQPLTPELQAEHEVIANKYAEKYSPSKK